MQTQVGALSSDKSILEWLKVILLFLIQKRETVLWYVMLWKCMLTLGKGNSCPAFRQKEAESFSCLCSFLIAFSSKWSLCQSGLLGGGPYSDLLHTYTSLLNFILLVSSLWEAWKCNSGCSLSEHKRKLSPIKHESSGLMQQLIPHLAEAPLTWCSSKKKSNQKLQSQQFLVGDLWFLLERPFLSPASL